MNLDLSIGDILLGGRFQNKRITVRSLGTNEIGQPTVNGRSLLRYRLEKKLPEEMKSSETRNASMEKKAYLQAVYQAAYQAELEKMAASLQASDLKRFSSLSNSLGSLIRRYDMPMEKTISAGRKFPIFRNKEEMIEFLKSNKPKRL